MLKLISINIEADKHLDRVIPFLKRESADVIYVQEILEKDVPLFIEELGVRAEFVPMCKNLVFKNAGTIGIAIFSKNELSQIRKDYYVGTPETLPEFDGEAPVDAYHDMINRLILSAKITVGDTEYQLATTHFTWTPNGDPTAYQLEDLGKLLRILKNIGQFVLAGDFNAPRGKETFSRLAQFCTDDIPLQYKTSLDPELHRVPGLSYMVDGLFTTSIYKAENVHLVSNISDHEAIVARIVRVQQ